MYLPQGCTRPDPAALDAFWAEARARVPELGGARGYQVRWIGMDERSTNAIFAVVRTADKTGTFTLHWIPEMTDQPVPQVGDCLVLIDWFGRPTLLVRLTELRTVHFGSVTDEDIAIDGSPVRDLAIWKPLHTRYWNWILEPFGREVSDDMPFWLERFELLYDADGPVSPAWRERRQSA
jgi:uncharacterized protein YhfF